MFVFRHCFRYAKKKKRKAVWFYYAKCFLKFQAVIFNSLILDTESCLNMASDFSVWKKKVLKDGVTTFQKNISIYIL